MKCEICQLEFDNSRNFGIHITRTHKVSLEEYYLKYIGEKKYCVVCGKETKFQNIEKGYNDCCSRECSNHNPLRAKKIAETNKKDEVIKKNIEKGKKTKLDRYGNENYNNLDKCKQTKLEKYGNENYNNREKAKLTYPTHTEENIKKYTETRYNNWVNTFSDKMNLFESEFVSREKDEISLKCKKCNNVYSYAKVTLNAFMKNKVYNICPFCYKNEHVSRNEKELLDYVSGLVKVIPNDRKVLNGKELDIYIPEKKLAIEYDGLFWHNIERDKGNMLKKTEECLKKDIQLIHIFEDEWIYKNEIVKSRIQGLLGLNDRIYARKCEIREITYKESEEFLNENHIQGNCTSKYRLGLYYNGELVSVMTFGKSRYKEEVELLRFCNKLYTNVIGGCSRLLKYFIKEYEINEIISFADRRWSNGNVYEKIGFKEETKNKPAIWYIDGQKRLNRLYGWKHDVSDKKVIYDCGTIKYRYTWKK